LISEVVDKTFVVELEDEEAEPQPYVNIAKTFLLCCCRAYIRQLRQKLHVKARHADGKLTQLTNVIGKKGCQ